MAKRNAKIFTWRFTMFLRQITPKPVCWWWTRNARRERGTRGTMFLFLSQRLRMLFGAAHWDELSPARRFTLVMFLVAVFPVAGALTEERFPALSTTFYAIGTVCMGAGIFLTAQIFNLQEHWPTGILMWAIGAL